MSGHRIPRWMKAPAGVCGMAVVLLLVSGVARANESTAEYDTSVAGQLVPKEETVLQVREEFLDIRFNPVPMEQSFIANFTGVAVLPPLRVQGVARYHIHNPSNQAVSPLLVFPLLFGGPEDQIEWVRGTNLVNFRNRTLPEPVRRGVRCDVRIDGRPIPFRYIPFESLFEEERGKWVKGVRAALYGGDDPEMSERRQRGAEVLDKHPDVHIFPAPYFCEVSSPVYPFETYRLPPEEIIQGEELLYYRQLVERQLKYHQWVADWDLDALAYAYRLLHPEEPDVVGEFLRRWGVEMEYWMPRDGSVRPMQAIGAGTMMIHYDLTRLRQRIDFLEYTPTFQPGADTVVEVSFSHLVDTDMRQRNPPDYDFWDYTRQFQYILRTSQNWKTFGPIHIQVAVPTAWDALMSLDLKYQREIDGYDCSSGDFPGDQVERNLMIGLDGHADIDWMQDWDAEHRKYLLDPEFCWSQAQANRGRSIESVWLVRLAKLFYAEGHKDGFDLRKWGAKLHVNSENLTTDSLSIACARKCLALVPDLPCRWRREAMILDALILNQTREPGPETINEFARVVNAPALRYPWEDKTKQQMYDRIDGIAQEIGQASDDGGREARLGAFRAEIALDELLHEANYQPLVGFLRNPPNDDRRERIRRAYPDLIDAGDQRPKTVVP